MEKKLDYYRDILPQFGRIGEPMTKEANICAQEFAERTSLGLWGEDAILHFNEWMALNNLPFRAEEQPQIWYDQTGAKSMEY